MSTSKRRRDLVFPIGSYKVTSKREGNYPVVVVSQGNLGTLKGTQYTESEGHQWPPRKGAAGDLGGPFYTVKNHASIPSGHSSHDGTQINSVTGVKTKFSHRGACLAHVPMNANGTAQWPPLPSGSNLNALGATAVARCSPTNSVADLATFLGELRREGLPSGNFRTWEGRTGRARGAGSDYLNAQFGWRPLVSEILNFGNAAIHGHSVLEQYDRDKGKNVRRSYDFPSTSSVTETVVGTNVFPSGMTGFTTTGDVGGTLVRSRLTEKRQWFRGCFTYGMPPLGDSGSGIADVAAKADKLFGLSLTPDVVWNLTPWSWAADWFTNTGDVLANVSDMASQGLVMRYGYMMEHTRVSDTYSLSPCRMLGNLVTAPSVTLTTESKVRVKANPFGFGLSWDGLSPFQLSILAALGITRS